MGRTVKEIAEDLQVTPQAVRDEIRKEGLQSTLQRRGRSFVIPEETESRIIAAITGRRNGEAMQSTLQSFAKNTQSTLHNFAIDFEQELARRDDEIRRLHDEIARLQAHEEQLTGTIRQLTESVNSLAVSVQAAQILHATSIERIAAKDTPADDVVPEQAVSDPAEEQPEKKSWWQRLFG